MSKGSAGLSSDATRMASLAQLVSGLVPAPEPVNDDHLVPECPSGFDGRDVLDDEIQIWQVVRDIGPQWNRAMRLECGLRANFDSHCWADVLVDGSHQRYQIRSVCLS